MDYMKYLLTSFLLFLNRFYKSNIFYKSNLFLKKDDSNLGFDERYNFTNHNTDELIKINDFFYKKKY